MASRSADCNFIFLIDDCWLIEKSVGWVIENCDKRPKINRYYLQERERKQENREKAVLLEEWLIE